jgi:hypothetical protein
MTPNTAKLHSRYAGEGTFHGGARGREAAVLTWLSKPADFTRGGQTRERRRLLCTARHRLVPGVIEARGGEAGACALLLYRTGVGAATIRPTHQCPPYAPE